MAKPYLKPNESRRSFIRVPFAPNEVVTIGPGRARRSYPALDVSVYGISFQAGAKDAASFRQGMALGQVRFNVYGRPVEVTARVAHVQAEPRDGRHRIALEFTDVKVDDTFLLSKFVAETAGLARPIQVGDKSRAVARAGARAKAKTAAKAKKKKAAKKAVKKTAKKRSVRR